MTRNQLIVHYAALLLLALAVGLWADMKAHQAARQAVAVSEAKEFAWWKGKLLPAYNQVAVAHAADPKDREELFGPLVTLMAQAARMPASATQPAQP